jgi:hypothetical protein
MLTIRIGRFLLLPNRTNFNEQLFHHVISGKEGRAISFRWFGYI